MTPEKFATHSLPRPQQLAAWRDWYDSVVDIESRQSAKKGFAAESLTWKLDGFAISHVSAPPASIARTATLVRRNPVDHWVVILGKHSATDLTYRDVSLKMPARVAFVVSLGDDGYSKRTQDERILLYLARDSFQEIAPALDAARGTALDTPQGRLLADYMLLLERNLRSLPAQSAPPLKNPVSAMVGACIAPSGDRMADAKPQIRLTLMERVRQSVRRQLRSPSLGPDKLCREAAMSRSQLYRLLEGEGGAAHYIQRLRLSESFAILCNTSNNLPIGVIAESLCFADASSFSRAFRREFGTSPSEVRAAVLVGLPPSAASRDSVGGEVRRFGDCLHLTSQARVAAQPARGSLQNRRDFGTQGIVLALRADQGPLNGL
jgi:AraC-like DNA-binding protein